MTAPQTPHEYGSHRQSPAPYQSEGAAVAHPASHTQRPQAPARREGSPLTGAEAFWYVLGNIAFAAMYFAKVPAKKALSEVGLAEMTSAERFWYVLQCIGFGAGYFAKLPVKKALTELL